MKKSVGIYLKAGVNPVKYGFTESDGGWKWHDKRLRTGMVIERESRKLKPFLGYSSMLVALIIRMAEDHALEVDEGDEDRPYLMRLTKEEALAIEKMRGHPKEDGK